MIKLIYAIIIYFVSMQTSAFAYLDPGTGSIILTAIISIFAFLSLKIKIILNKIKNFFEKKKDIKSN